MAGLLPSNKDFLLEREQRLRLALETGGIGLWVWNSSDVSNAGDWSPRLKEIFGLPPGTKVTHDLFLKCVHPDDRDRVNEAVMQAITGANGGAYHLEYRAIHSDDSVHWVTARGQAFFNPDGTPFRFIGTVMDITDRKQAEHVVARTNQQLEGRIAERTADLELANKALAESQSYLHMAIDTIPGLVWTSLPDGNIEFLNQRWLQYTGMRHEEACGWGWQAAIHPDDLAGLAAYWQSILAAGEAGEYEARLRRFDGEYRWFLFRGLPLFDEANNVVKWYGTNTDVQDLRISEHLARGQVDAMTELLNVLAAESDPEQLPKHVVNTILTRLGAFSVTIWERKGDRLDLLGVTDEGKYRTREEAQYFEGSIPVVGHAPPLWVEALQTGSHILIEDIDRELPRITLSDGRSAVWHEADITRPFANLKAHLSAQGVRALLIVPLLLAGELAGIIGIRFRGTRVFHCEEIELTKALAHQAMLALQLMHLSRQSRQSAVEAERNRLARDIHDTLAQGFTGVIMQLQAARGAAARSAGEEAASHIDRAEELARASLGEARRSVRALRPHSLAKGTLCAALEALFKRMTDGTNLEARLQINGDRRPLSLDAEEGLLRIAQESLTNTLKHARARRFLATLTFSPTRVELRLADDGCGFDPAASHEGFGLLGMRERADRMGSQFILRSEPGAPTEILVLLNHSSESQAFTENGHVETF